jgi:hypothetical protein
VSSGLRLVSEMTPPLVYSQGVPSRQSLTTLSIRRHHPVLSPRAYRSGGRSRWYPREATYHRAGEWRAHVR